MNMIAKDYVLCGVVRTCVLGHLLGPCLYFRKALKENTFSESWRTIYLAAPSIIFPLKQ